MSLLLVTVTVPMLIGTEVSSVEARRRYKYPHKKKYNYGAKIARCQKKCNAKAGVIRKCILADRKRDIKNCKDVYKADKASCTGSDCKVRLKDALKSCMRDAGQIANEARKELSGKYSGSKACGNCCRRTKGSGYGTCVGYFSGSRWYGSYRRGKRVVCVSGYGTTTTTSTTLPGSPSGAFTSEISAGIRGRLARLVPWLTEGWSD